MEVDFGVSEAVWTPYSERDEWADVAPIPQDDGPNAVVRISYTEQFRETMDYFRAIMFANERSERSLELTADVINQNAGNYTAWHFRRLVLIALEKDLREELKFIAEVSMQNPKNYQLWYHRRCIVEKLGDPSKELDFCESKLEEDAKNYHAWAHRQWVLKKYKLWDGELQFCDTKIQEDIRNNSAWNQRYFVFVNTETPLSLATKRLEIQYAIRYIKMAPNNESPWNYLRGLAVIGSKFSDFPFIKEEVLAIQSRHPECPFVRSLLVDILEEENSLNSLRDAIKACGHLAKDVDPIRGKYWNYRSSSILGKIDTLRASAP